MTDMTFLPSETLRTIADDLTPAELAQFRLVSRAFNYAATDMAFLQPLYNRLYAMDSTLPATLEVGNKISLFNQAFLKIRDAQQEEIDYLKQFYGHLPKLQKCILDTPPTTIHELENRHQLLNDINCYLIQCNIDLDPTSVELNVNHLNITRFPVALLKAKNPDYFNNLTILKCSSNHLTVLDLREAIALKEVHSKNNPLTHLNVQGLKHLRVLKCFFNKSTYLNYSNLQELISVDHLGLPPPNNTLTHLNIENCLNLQPFFVPPINNALIDIKLKGSSLETTDVYQNLEIMLLLKQLSAAQKDKDISSIIVRLDKNFTLANCITHLGFKAGSSLYSYHTAQSMTNSFYGSFGSYLPSFSSATPEIVPEENQSNTSTKRVREEDSNNTQSEHPAKKRRK